MSLRSKKGINVALVAKQFGGGGHHNSAGCSIRGLEKKKDAESAGSARHGMKYILVVPDGMGDKPVRALKGKTPLEAAHTPHMDYFARHGVVGLTRNIPEGFVPGTDIGCMSVFGYDPRKYFTGRGPLEAGRARDRTWAEGPGVPLQSCYDRREGVEDFSADHISLSEAKVLIEALDRAVQKEMKGQVRFYAGKGTGYRHLVVVKNAPRDLAKMKCAPPHDIMGREYEKIFA